MSFKEILKKLVPPLVLDLKRWIFPYEVKLADWSEAKNRFEDFNKDCGANQIRLRPDLPPFTISTDSRESYLHFCYLDDTMIKELDAFLLLAKDKQNFLDVGALHGLFALTFSALSEANRSLAVEPSPGAFPDLMYNVHKNFPAQIVLEESALSNTSGTIEMFADWKHLIARGAYEKNGEKSLYYSICSIIGDELCSSRNFKPDLIKIDVEGFEFSVLQGLRKTLQENRPTVCLEIHPSLLLNLGTSAREVFAFFNDLQYQFYNDQLELIESESAKNFTEIVRVVVNPEEFHEDIQKLRELLPKQQSRPEGNQDGSF